MKILRSAKPILILASLVALAAVGLAQTFWAPPRELVLKHSEIRGSAINLNEPEEITEILKPGTESTIFWKDAKKHNLEEYALIYLHGFTGFRSELSPLLESLQKELPANLYFQRISGHGMNDKKIERVGIQDWLNDAETAYTYGQAIGKKQVYFALSTGAGLSLYLAKKVPHDSCIVLFSPNFGLQNILSRLFTGPWGAPLGQMLFGSSVSLEQAQISTATAVDFLEMTKAFRAMSLGELRNPLLMFYAADDDVIDKGMAQKKYQEAGSAVKQLVVVPRGGHLLYDWTSPSEVDKPVQLIKEFVLKNCR